MPLKFLGPSASVTIVALSLTPELTNAFAILIAAVFVGVVNLYMARTARMLILKEIALAVAPVEQKIDAIAPVVAKIDTHVNGEKTRAEGESLAQKLQITLQREMIEEMKKAAALLAQAKAATDTSMAVAQAVRGRATAQAPPAPTKETL